MAHSYLISILLKTFRVIVVVLQENIEGYYLVVDIPGDESTFVPMFASPFKKSKRTVLSMGAWVQLM
jgi:hypothetical protein